MVKKGYCIPSTITENIPDQSCISNRWTPCMLEYLHLKLICIPSFEHDIQCTTFATNHIQEGEIPNLLSFWVHRKEYEKF